MNFPKRLVFAALAIVAVTLSSPSLARDPAYPGDVYFVRGFADIFSRGFDDMSKRLKRRGINTKVISHVAWRGAVMRIVDNQKKYGRVPVILIGHSLGANAVIRIARQLQRRNITIQYMATLEPTERLKVPSNVRTAINYYLSNSIMGLPMKKQPGSPGSFRNVDMIGIPGIGHFNMDENVELQRAVITNIVRYIRPVRESALLSAKSALLAAR